MARSHKDAVPVVELLGVGVVTTASGGSPAVRITIRPEPGTSWRTHTFAITVEQAGRLRDDLAVVVPQAEPVKQTRKKKERK
jgi:hypothetical protein